MSISTKLQYLQIRIYNYHVHNNKGSFDAKPIYLGLSQELSRKNKRSSAGTDF